MSDVLLSLSGVHKSYGATRALREIKGMRLKKRRDARPRHYNLARHCHGTGGGARANAAATTTTIGPTQIQANASRARPSFAAVGLILRGKAAPDAPDLSPV